MTNMLRRHGLSIAFLVVLVFAYKFLAPDSAEIHELGGATMGTTYSIKVVDMPDGVSAAQFAEAINDLLTHLDREQMSTYTEDSELSRFNRAELGSAVPLSAELAEVMALALDVSELTDGAFDVTVGPLVNRWGFGPQPRNPLLPDDAEIAQLMTSVGYRHLELDRSAATLTKTADVYVDLSGIAKGYGVDLVAEYFDSLGIASYFIEVGGELRIKGYKPGKQSWVPAIETPVDSAPQVYDIFYAHGESIAVAGSGDYRNYFEEDGVHYSHEIDPHTGKPATNSLAGVYVIDASAARADAFATAFMVMGAERGFVLAERLDLAVYFITRTAQNDGFEDRYTHRFENYLKVE